MSLWFTDARWQARGLPEPYDVVLGVEATLHLTSGDGRLVYREELFPVVELALAVSGWLRGGLGRGEDFSFDSVESDDPGLLWCRAQDDGWRVGALDQEFADVRVYATGQVERMFTNFVGDVDSWLDASLGRSLAAVAG